MCTCMVHRGGGRGGGGGGEGGGDTHNGQLSKTLGPRIMMKLNSEVIYGRPVTMAKDLSRTNSKEGVQR